MEKNSKLLKGAKVLMLLLIASIFITSCKKDQFVKNPNILTDEQQIANAKSWYESQQKFLSSTIKSSKDEEAKLIFNPNWEKATVEMINGVSVISTFVNTTLRNFDQGQTKFNLVIKFDDGVYEAKTVTVRNAERNDLHVLRPSELYSIAFTKNELENNDVNAQIKVYSQTFKQEKEELYDANGRKTIDFKSNKTSRTNVIVDVCRHYWLIIDFYSSNNVLLGTETTYLGYFCESMDIQTIDYLDNGDGTYSGGDGIESEEIEWGDISNESNLSQIDTTALDLANITFDETAFYWEVYTAKGGIKFEALQRVSVSKAYFGWAWVVDYCRNEGIFSTGNSTDNRGWAVSAELTSYQDLSDEFRPGAQINFKDKRSKTTRGVPKTKEKDYMQRAYWTRTQLFKH